MTLPFHSSAFGSMSDIAEDGAKHGDQVFTR
jgi:hypothetical protein